MKSLPVVDCRGCGVCCLHMGYPPFLRPIEPVPPEVIDRDPELLARIEADPRLRSELEQGQAGEVWWHRLPENLRVELDAYIETYQHREYGPDVESLDGPCYWFDPETRQCKHHAHRPRVCRDFEIGSRLCRQWRDYYRDQVTNPGSED